MIKISQKEIIILFLSTEAFFSSLILSYINFYLPYSEKRARLFPPDTLKHRNIFLYETYSSKDLQKKMNLLYQRRPAGASSRSLLSETDYVKIPELALPAPAGLSGGCLR